MTRRYVCIHGHFYQPPRENAWLEEVDVQSSAAPYHDWNERITAECYAPNAEARILDEGGRIRAIRDNYSRISFNFGPTLLSWMERAAPDTYAAILEADRVSCRRFGHGSAMAQVYGHAILPLCNARDRRTQVRWGLTDFAHRFGREAEGMWLPETAVNLASLEALAAEGVRFTVLAPSQAARWRTIGEDDWSEVETAGLDTRRPYRVSLPSGRSLAVFVYDGELSQSIAFGQALSDGAALARQLIAPLDERGDPHLVHVATDGETYGHHHRFGEMALAYALSTLERHPAVELINYATFLARHPPTHELEIRENTAWSCAHGLGRWQDDCGCSTGSHRRWTQAWRRPLRDALDWLRDSLATPFERVAGELLGDPWAARNAYVEVILDRSPTTVRSFLARHGRRSLDDAERTQVLRLLELQRHAQLMYTSCAWFFDDVAGIEPTQVLQYAARAIELGRQALGLDLEAEFLKRLERARANDPELRTARDVYLHRVGRRGITPARVAANVAAARLAGGGDRRFAAYEVQAEDVHVRRTAGRGLVFGRFSIESRITLERESVETVFFQRGDHDVAGGVSARALPRDVVDGLIHHFERQDEPALTRLLERTFPQGTCSLRDLFPDEQRRLLDSGLSGLLDAVAEAYRGIYRQHAPLMRHLQALDTPLPRALQAAADFVLNEDLAAALSAEPLSVERVRERVEEARRAGVRLEGERLGYVAAARMGALLDALADAPRDTARLRAARDLALLLADLPFTVDLHRAQNRLWRLVHGLPPRSDGRSEPSPEPWLAELHALGDALGVVIAA